MKNAYRAPAAEEAKNNEAATLSCWLQDGDKNRWMRLVFVKSWATLGACGVVSLNGPSGWSLLALALGAAWVGRDVRNRKGHGVVFHVENGRLTVKRPGEADLDVTLAQLHEVRLDTKASSRDLTISRSDGVNSAFGMSSGHSIEFDVSRIELVTKGKVHLLMNEFISNSKCMEKMRIIRRFLRAQGWKPIDERG